MRLDGYYGTGSAQFSYDEPMPGQDRRVIVPSNSRCIETEEGVAWLLCGKQWALGACVTLHYRDHPGWTAQIQADALGVEVRELYRRLHQAQLCLLEYFIDRAVGVVPQTEQLRKQQLKLTEE